MIEFINFKYFFRQILVKLLEFVGHKNLFLHNPQTCRGTQLVQYIRILLIGFGDSCLKFIQQKSLF